MSTLESTRPQHKDRPSGIPTDEIEEQLRNGTDPKRVQERLIEEFLEQEPADIPFAAELGCPLSSDHTGRSRELSIAPAAGAAGTAEIAERLTARTRIHFDGSVVSRTAVTSIGYERIVRVRTH